MDIVKKKKIKNLTMVQKPKWNGMSIHLMRRNQVEWNINEMDRDFNGSFSRLEVEHKRRMKKIKRNRNLMYAGIIIYWISYVTYMIINHK